MRLTMPTPGLYGSSVGKNMVRAAAAELAGTSILVYTGTAVATAAILDRPTAGQAYDSLGIALAFGLALVALAAALGHVSGAHLNPAVTLSLAAIRKFPLRYVPAYLSAQLVGAVLGSLATWATVGAGGRRPAYLAATYPFPGVGSGRALLVEALVTFILVLVIVSVATDGRVPPGVAGIAIGLALAVGVLIAGPITGGAVNPARALGPMVVAGRLTSWWVYVVGPVLGGVAAAVFYDRFLKGAEAPNEADDAGVVPRMGAAQVDGRRAGAVRVGERHDGRR